MFAAISTNGMPHFGHIGAPLPAGAGVSSTASSRTAIAGVETIAGRVFFPSPSMASNLSRRDIDFPSFRFRSLLDELRQVRRGCQKVFILIVSRFDERHY